MDDHDHERPRRGLSRATWALLGFLAVAGYFLLTEHRAHFLYYLPFVLVLACPLLHLLHGHGGHGHGGHGHGPSARGAGQSGANEPDDRGHPQRGAGDGR